MREIEEVEIFGERMLNASVFCILTDQYSRVLHFSENFLQCFKISDKSLNRELSIDSLINGIPSDFFTSENEDDHYNN
jgi:hypothetical protein